MKTKQLTPFNFLRLFDIKNTDSDIFCNLIIGYDYSSFSYYIKRFLMIINLFLCSIYYKLGFSKYIIFLGIVDNKAIGLCSMAVSKSSENLMILSSYTCNK